MPAVNFQGKAEDGRQYKFSNDQGAIFAAYVPDGLPSMVDGMAAGTRIEAVVEQKTSKTGNAYTQVTSINGKDGKQFGGGKFGGKAPYKYEPKRFVEAVVSSAISAKAISSPEQIEQWAKAAWKAVSTLETGAIKETIGTQQPAAAVQPSNAAPNDAIPF